jgi:ketosteroid isomerase-like protein
MVDLDSDAADVHAVNRRFYEAFEERDLDAMSDVWSRSDQVTCTHPGWPSLRGWGPIAASFFVLFQSGQALQFVLTREQIEVNGDIGWATVDENLLGAGEGATVSALNLFVRHPADGIWRMVAHHGSVVNTSIGVEHGPAAHDDDDAHDDDAGAGGPQA